MLYDKTHPGGGRRLAGGAAALALAGMLCGAPPVGMSAGVTPWTALTYAPAPVDNPLKGFMPYAGTGTASSFPHSMEFFYLPVRSVMTGPRAFAWRALEAQLNEIASRGHQAVFRFYLDYPTRPSGIPAYLLAAGLKVHPYTDYNNTTSVSPDYDDPRLRTAMVRFIGALGRRYDGDPRIGFIEVGLIGFWGEWHTYPHDEWSASLTTMDLVLRTYTAAFRRTKLLVRRPVDPITVFPVGYHDDSFAYDTVATGNGNFMDDLEQAHVQDIWRTEPIGGEVRPELQPCLWQHPSCAGPPQDYATAVDVTHATWLLNQWVFDHRLSGGAYARALAGARRLGYELYVSAVALPPAGSAGPLLIRVQMRNTGRAPFYDDWPIELGLVGGHRLVTRWRTTWRLTRVLPGAPTAFTALWAHPAVPPGRYTLVMRAVDPLTGGRPLRFADKAQDGTLAGWLTLGSISTPPVADPRGDEPRGWWDVPVAEVSGRPTRGWASLAKRIEQANSHARRTGGRACAALATVGIPLCERGAQRGQTESYARLRRW